jgi:hypothetical protein
MELINLDVSEYGINLTTYFGDVYVFWRTLALAALIFVMLRLAKAYRAKARLSGRKFG